MISFNPKTKNNKKIEFFKIILFKSTY